MQQAEYSCDKLEEARQENETLLQENETLAKELQEFTRLVETQQHLLDDKEEKMQFFMQEVQRCEDQNIDLRRTSQLKKLSNAQVLQETWNW